jgi:hypothetical protein
MVASLDHFIKKRIMNKIFLIIKRSRLEFKKLRSGFRMQNGRQTIQNPDNLSGF